MKLPVVANAADYELHLHSDVWRQAASIICERHKLHGLSLERSGQGENIVFFAGNRFVIKIFAPFRESYLREKCALSFASGRIGIETPEVLHAGELEGWSYLVMTRLAGQPAREVWPRIETRGRAEIVSRLGAALKTLHGLSVPSIRPGPYTDWQAFIERQAETVVERQRSCGASERWLESLPAYVDAGLRLLPEDDSPVMLHGDVHLGNLLLEEARGGWKISGLFDFGDSLAGFHEYDFVAPGVLMIQGDGQLQRVFLSAYGYRESEMGEKLRSRLMLLTILYENSDLRKYALRLKPEAVDFTLAGLEAAIWKFAAET